ncbi:hypothetical protein WAI453_006628 [Rhynchosporium graminicola]
MGGIFWRRKENTGYASLMGVFTLKYHVMFMQNCELRTALNHLVGITLCGYLDPKQGDISGRLNLGSVPAALAAMD